MLRLGLTGGIGSGKSTVSERMAGLGAVVVDADVVAHEVVEPGTPALVAITERFGADVLAADGSLDRPGLGRVVFGAAAALRDLEAITHPAIWARTAELVAAAPADAVVVHDMPLLVEKDMTGEYHLVAVVGASEETRLDRLVTLRKMSEADARARIAAQAGDAARRAAADVWLDNEASREELLGAVDALWQERVVPFEENLLRGIPAVRPDRVAMAPPDPTWPEQATRLMARIRYAARSSGAWAAGTTLDHIGSTAVPGLVAKDVVDLQLGVASLAEADEARFVGALAGAGFVRIEEVRSDSGKDGTSWPKRFHRGCDPGRAVHLHVREVGSPGWRWARGFRDWLRADAAAREEYAALKLALAALDLAPEEYAQAKEPWFDAVGPRVERWVTAARPFY